MRYYSVLLEYVACNLTADAGMGARAGVPDVRYLRSKLMALDADDYARSQLIIPFEQLSYASGFECPFTYARCY